ncbi:hypothetical protein C1A38_06740 [Verrucosispora sp. ts21]|uniref:AAA family ATPase n=1 Tax=Verrucosispora sp. ts21 TaxID=2069341 RepID=UPI000C889B7B|nr:AAA family ATPase [Verrucosispora sp. ts21]PMR61785.1 hypothetical protein C1A38_06740 [Verrucosispora sp. ts21]
MDTNAYLALDQNGRFITSPASLADRVAALKAEWHTRTALKSLPKIEPMVADTYGRHSYIVLAGRNYTYKSFIATDLGCCHATGKPWLGTREVVQGRVLYLIGEGAYDQDNRITAWEKHNGTEVPAENFITFPRTPRLFNNAAELEALNELIRQERFVLVIIDTLRRASGEAKGNSNDDMGQVVDAIEDIKRATDNGSVLVIAHTDAEDTKVRGATNIEDDADYVYRTQRVNSNQVKLWRTKNKYGPEDDTHQLRATLVADSLVLAPDEARVLRLGDREQAEAKVLLEIIASAGGSVRGFNSLKSQGLNNSRIRPALTWLEDRGYITVNTDGRTHEYVKARDWEVTE